MGETRSYAAGDASRSARSGPAPGATGGAFRRAALVALDVSNRAFSSAEGLAIAIRRDKTD